jgi:predicted Ser/Thr protein kinase
VELIPTGKSNTNFKLALSDGMMAILRRFSDVGMNSPQRERRIAELVGGRVPVPAILDLGEDWILSEFAPGETLEDSPTGVGAAAEALAHLRRSNLALVGGFRRMAWSCRSTSGTAMWR